MRLSLLAALAFLAGGTAARAESAAPARVEMTDDGPLLLTPAGKTLYTFGGDDNVPGRSACSDEAVRDFPDPTAGLGKYPLPGHTFALSCVQVWPPFMAPADATPTGDWGVIERKEGRQWTYRKHPLYTSVSDVRPGDRNGSTGPTFGRGGFRLAAGPLQFPPGLSFTRVGGELVLATATGRPVYACARPGCSGPASAAPTHSSRLRRPRWQHRTAIGPLSRTRPVSANTPSRAGHCTSLPRA